MKNFETIRWLKMFRASTAATAAFDRCNDKKVVKTDLEWKCYERLQQSTTMDINLRSFLKKVFYCSTSRLE